MAFLLFLEKGGRTKTNKNGKCKRDNKKIKEVNKLQIVTFCNWKGGCAKTTSVWAFGVGLANKGYKVLLVDLDAQSNLSYTASVDLLEQNNTLYNVLKGNINITDAVQGVRDNLDIITGGYALCGADMDFTQLGREYLLKDAIEPIQNNYDFIVIDTAPHIGVLMMNALTVADKVILPMQADIYSLQGIERLTEFINDIKKYSNPRLKVEGLLITRTDERTTLTKTMVADFEEVAKDFKSKVFKARIRATVSVGESALLKSDLYQVAPNGTATLDYLDFIQEFLEG